MKQEERIKLTDDEYNTLITKLNQFKAVVDEAKRGCKFCDFEFLNSFRTWDLAFYCKSVERRHNSRYIVDCITSEIDLTNDASLDESLKNFDSNYRDTGFREPDSTDLDDCFYPEEIIEMAKDFKEPYNGYFRQQVVSVLSYFHYDEDVKLFEQGDADKVISKYEKLVSNKGKDSLSNTDVDMDII